MKKVKKFSRKYLWKGILVATTITAICGFFAFSGTALAARTITGATLNGANSVTVLPNASINAAVTVTTSGEANDWRSLKWQIGTGSTPCVNFEPDHTSDGTYTESFSITAPSNLGTYDVSFWAYDNDTCSSGESSISTLTDRITVVNASIAPSKDSYVDQHNAGSNYGTITTLSVRSTTSDSPNKNHRTLVGGFDLSTIPSNAVITSATLNLYMSATPSASRTYNIYRVTSSWTEAGVTWGTQPTATGTATSSVSTGTTDNVWRSWNVSSDVQSFVSGTANYGWLIRDSIEDSTSDQEGIFRSREYTGTTNDPYLGVTYTSCGNSIIETGEQCDDGNTNNGDCCSSTCQYESSSTVCRAATGTGCDIAETCTGSTASCPSDAVQPNTFICRGSAGDCDLAETCDGSTKNCPTDVFKSQGTSCTDGNPCNGAETCNGAGTCSSGAPLTCNDSNLCTTDSCNSQSGCVYSPNQNSCDDGNACTTNDQCSAGTCSSGAPLTCNDSNLCTTDSCDSQAGCIFATAPLGTSCADGLYCNGDETCNGAGACTGGSAVDCSANSLPEIATCIYDPDTNPFTWDSRNPFTSTCDETADSCTDGNAIPITHTGNDNDRDGYASNCGDCDDTNANINPGATEVCGNGVDEDCSGSDATCPGPTCTDSDQDGYYAEGGQCGPIDCNDNDRAINPGATEICDNLDNDCDGSIDESLTRPTTCGVGACASTGIETCSAGVYGGNTCTAGTPGTETCNNIDDNCDGTVDESLTRGTTCGVGACASTGIETCSAGVYGGNTCTAGTPGAELCDGILDEDCDGSRDEDCLCTDLDPPLQCGTDVGECAFGTQTCTNGTWGGCVGATGPTDEVCDGLDNDCDSSIDEGLIRPYYTGPAGTENVGECKTGTETCSAGIWSVTTPEATPSLEVCDALDNNCDGSIADDGIGESWYQQATSCGVGECASTGMFICQGAAKTDTCQAGAPTAELCDNKDNDCDRSTDEDLTQATTCGVGACLGNTGTETCTAGVWGGDTCNPYVGATTEVCNEVDDNCDGTVNENWVCDVTPPTITINDKFLVANAGESVSFSATTSDDVSGILGVGWDFGDTGTATGTETAHTYTAGGAYTVTATATDNAGKTATDTAKVIIGQTNFTPDGVPDANLTFNNLPGDSFTFTVTESDTTSTDTSGFLVGGKFYEFTSSLTNGNFNVTITFNYADADNDGIVDGTSINENDLDVYYWDGSAWTVVPNPVRDAVNNTITVTVDHFTQFGLMALVPSPSSSSVSSSRGGGFVGGGSTPIIKEVKGWEIKETLKKIAEVIGIPEITGETPEEITEEGTPSSSLAQEKMAIVPPERGLASMLAALGMVIGQSAWKMIVVILSLMGLIVIGAKEWKKARKKKK